MQEINIEDIMKEIRSDIAAKGYTRDALSFDDVVLDDDCMKYDHFDKIEFSQELYVLNHNWDVKAYRQFENNGGIAGKFKNFFKKSIRKMVKFYVEPIVTDQNRYNASTIRSLNLLECYINEQTVEIVGLKNQIQELDRKISKLERAIKEK